MIIPYDTDPISSIYYITTLVLRTLNEKKEMKIADLFNYLKKYTFKSIQYSLDMLFILGKITIKEETICYVS
jgi:hypothetical protein